MTNFIVCGCCAAGAAYRAFPLRRRLDSLRTLHDLVAVDPHPGRAAPVPCRPLQIRDAMDRHPGRTILFLDIDCQIVGTRDDLARAADIEGDIAFHARTHAYPDGKVGIVPHPETLVLRPTAKARVFISAWIESWERAAPSGSEQDTLTSALARVPELSVTLLGAEFCAAKQDSHPLPVILRARAATTPGGTFEALLRRLRAARHAFASS
jgi:hypothetical protein